MRQPLRELRVAVVQPELLGQFVPLIAGELNVRSVVLLDVAAVTAGEYGVSAQLSVNARAAGPRLGRGVQDVIRAAKSGAWEQRADGAVVVTTAGGDVALLETEYELRTVVHSHEGDEIAAAILPGAGFVVLDLGLDEGLRAEGYARDVVRAAQDARKAAGLRVTDRIRLRLGVPAAWRTAVAVHHSLITKETLAMDLVVDDTAGDELTVAVERIGAGAGAGA